jgi:molybdopterin-binding protein/molybdate transport repressor ModE-like protein
MINRLMVRVESTGSPAWLRAGRARLAARPWPGIRAGRRLAVAIAPEDVILCESHPGRTSARNVLPGHVRAVRRASDGVRVLLDVGFPLTALVTSQAAAELRLIPSRAVYALVKASAVVPEVAVEAPFRVCPRGTRGLLLPDQMDFLGAVGRAGSLSAAARELGMHYRTAWMRARAVNRLWGPPLVAPAPGGSFLTPAGRALLALSAKIEGPSGKISSR